MGPTGLRKRRWRRWLWLLLFLVAIPATLLALRGRGAKPVAVTVHTVERGTVRDFVTSIAAGRVAARREVTLRAEFVGTVRTLHHRRGERVAANDPLISFDQQDLRDRLRVTEATVLLGRAQAAQAASSAQVAELNANRAQRLKLAGAAPAAEVENLAGQAEVAKRSVEAARAGINQALANVELARNALRKGVLRAPFAGTVITTAIEEGEVSTPGAPLFTLADLGELHVDAEIDEADLGRVGEGLPAEVALDAFPGQRFHGRLTQIAPSVTRDLRGNRSVAIDVALDPDPRIRLGMSADVDVIVAVRKDVLWVPPNAVQGRGKDRAVLVVDQGVARRRAIVPGISTWESVEVAGGLDAGAPVIVNLSAPDLVDGAKVVVDTVATRGSSARGGER